MVACGFSAGALVGAAYRSTPTLCLSWADACRNDLPLRVWSTMGPDVTPDLCLAARSPSASGSGVGSAAAVG